MNRTVFSLPPSIEYRTARGLDVARQVSEFGGGAALDELIELLDTRRGVVLSSGTNVPGRYESFDLGFADPPLRLESNGVNFFIEALN
ncbi:MAG TPA: anthranilate synthase component I, partial [Afipia sp.]